MGYYYNFESANIFVPAEKVPDMLNALMPIAKEAMRSQKLYDIARYERESQDDRYSGKHREIRTKEVDEIRSSLTELSDRMLLRDEIFANIVWSLNFDEGGNLVNIYHSESKHTDFDELEAMAPFMRDGGYVEIQGEDRGDLYRKVFRGGIMKHVPVVISFPEED